MAIKKITLTEDHIKLIKGLKFEAFEMKWNPRKANSVIPKPFLESYEVGDKSVTTPQNYLEHLL